MLKRLSENEEGLVFVTVLLIIIVMTIVTISIVSMNINQVKMTEGEAKRIQAELLAEGALSYTFAEQMTATPSDTLTLNEPLGNVTYSVTSTLTRDASGPNGTDPVDVLISY